MLAPGDHGHEAGEDTTRCTNCQFDKLRRDMSMFELATWNWYCDNVSSLVLEGGLLAMLIADTEFTGRAKQWFIRGLSMIRDTVNRIAFEKSKDKERTDG